jgi:glycerol-3-phosphate dehydrogenase (NAD(P)+)
LAALLARSGYPVRLWCLEPDLAQEMRQTRRNSRYRPEAELPPHISIHTDLDEALDKAQAAVLAVPSRWLAPTVAPAREILSTLPLLISATKGLHEETGQRMSEMLQEVLGAELPLAVLSGPNLSGEIARGKPAVAVVGGAEPVTRRAQQLLGTPLFRVYRNCDIIGVELGGALKNVIALAAGVSDGLGYGANAKAALVTRGLAEMGRLGVALGAQPMTFWGAAGVGDLVATCNSTDSRNWNVGYRLAQGESWEQIRTAMQSVAEGVHTALAAQRLARERDISAPLTEALCGVIFGGVAVETAVRELMTRPEKAEDEDWFTVSSPG